MNTLKIDQDLTNLVNNPFLSVCSYVDLENMSIEVYPEGMETNDKLLRIPYADELYSYGHLMSEYIDKNDLCIPIKMSARKYLIEQGYYYDFCDFRNERLEKALIHWFAEHQIKVELVA